MSIYARIGGGLALKLRMNKGFGIRSGLDYQHVKSGIYTSFRINTRFWCGRKERSDGIARNERPGIEDVRRYEKSLDFQGFFAIERQRGRQNFWKV